MTTPASARTALARLHAQTCLHAPKHLHENADANHAEVLEYIEGLEAAVRSHGTTLSAPDCRKCHITPCMCAAMGET